MRRSGFRVLSLASVRRTLRLAVGLVALGIANETAAQNRNYDRYGRDFRLHGNGFDRGQGGIYSGNRATNTRGFHRYGGNPYLYSPYAVPPYAYDPTFASPGFIGVAQPFSPYVVPGVAYQGVSYGNIGFGGLGYSNFGYGFNSVEVYGPGAIIPTPPPAVYITPPVTERPVEYHVAESKSDAQRLRAMMRDADTNLPHVAARQLTVAESTPEDRLRSVREEQAGDRDFAAGRFLLAYTHYKNAIDRAGDRAEPRAKLFVTYTTIGQYEKAIDALKNLLQLDPQYPQHFIALDAIFGSKQLTKESVKTTTAQWAAQYVANPERLLLLAALMYFDGDVERSLQLFEEVNRFDDLRPFTQGFLPTGQSAPDTSPQAFGGDLEIPKPDDADFDLAAPPLPAP